MGLSADISEFTKVLNEYLPTTKKALSEVLNERARNIAYKAAAAQPTARQQKIKRDLLADPHLLAALTSLSLKKKGIGRLPAPQFQQAMNALVQRRMAAARYLRSAWAKIIVDLGGSFRGSNLKPTGAERTSHSYGHRATVVQLLAELGWKVDEPDPAKAATAEREGYKALRAGIQGETQQLAKHTQEKLAKLFK